MAGDEMAASSSHADRPADHLMVAPREITDIVARASRVVGCEAGVAERIAADVTHVEIHHGCGLREFLDLATKDPTGLQRAAVEAIVPHAATPRLLRRRGHERRTSASAAVEHDALARGVQVDTAQWADLEEMAAKFLLSELILDADASR